MVNVAVKFVFSTLPYYLIFTNWHVFILNAHTELIWYTIMDPLELERPLQLAVLNTVRRLYPKVDYYSKMGGLSKFFDAYDNQPICWIDDPVSPSVLRIGDEEPVQRSKTVISIGEVLVEV